MNEHKNGTERDTEDDAKIAALHWKFIVIKMASERIAQGMLKA